MTHQQQKWSNQEAQPVVEALRACTGFLWEINNGEIHIGLESYEFDSLRKNPILAECAIKLSTHTSTEENSGYRVSVKEIQHVELLFQRAAKKIMDEGGLEAVMQHWQALHMQQRDKGTSDDPEAVRKMGASLTFLFPNVQWNISNRDESDKAISPVNSICTSGLMPEAAACIEQALSKLGISSQIFYALGNEEAVVNVCRFDKKTFAAINRLVEQGAKQAATLPKNSVQAGSLQAGSVAAKMYAPIEQKVFLP